VVVVSLKGILGRKLRAILTALAIVLGVAMISGTYVLTDTINAGFDTIFTQSYKNADVVITGKAAFGGSNDTQVETPSFPESVLTKVEALPDVAAAAGSLQSEDVKLLRKNGKVINTRGAPNLGFSVDPKANQQFNPLSLAEGHWPLGPTQIAIDKGTADKQHYDLGQTIGVQVNGPVREFEIVGITRFASVDSIGSATIAVFDPPTAQQLFGKQGQLDIIRVQSKAGVPSSKLLSEIRPLLPATAQVRDAQAQAKEDKKDVDQFLGIIQKALLAFGGVALFVGGFVIANTLSITIAQRMREFATLRTIGASRRQVLLSVVLEALVVGAIASVIGLLAGLGLAKGLNSLFVTFGIDLPKSSTVFATRTIIVALAVGILITLLASLRPAIRATRVPPIAAVREGATLPRSRFARFGTPGALAILAIGVGLLVYGVLGDGIDIALRLLLLGLGVLLMFLGVAMNAPKLVPPLAGVLGWPATRVGGAAGALARDNTMRNPSRTASTAAALMIGLALVTFVAVLGQGLRSSFEDAVDRLFVADYAITSENTFTPLTIEAEKAVSLAPEVTAVSGIRAGSARYLAGTHNLTAVNPAARKVLHLDWTAGSDRVFSQLGDDGLFTDDKYAEKEDLRLGSNVRVQFPSGKFVDLKVRGIYEKPKGGTPFGNVTISSGLFDRSYAKPQNEMALVNMNGGVSDSNTARLELPLKSFPDAKVQTQSEFKKSFEGPLNNLLNLLYVLLALSILISFFGIVNTLVLTVFERTRELGMLRAVGMTRRQTRRMIRHESIVTSLIGAVLGMVVGILLSLLVTQALSSEGFIFAVPYNQLAYFLVAVIFVGIVAAILPARRAARLNVLEALQYE
jgi:putative ABC transport system permease protein